MTYRKQAQISNYTKKENATQDYQHLQATSQENKSKSAM